MKPELNKIYQGDTLETLKQWPNEFVDCVITSPPYWQLRDYNVKGQIGLEKTLDEYFDKLLAITKELKRVLKPTGTLWWNHGDSYGTKSGGTQQLANGAILTQYGKIKYGAERFAVSQGRDKGVPEKSLLLQNFRLAQRMIDEQKLILRNLLIWHKPNCMPSSVKDRFTIDFEPVFFFTKSKKYYFETQLEKSIWGDKDKRAITGPTSGGKVKSGNYAINNAGAYRKQDMVGRNDYTGFNDRYNPVIMRNRRSVWTISTKPYSEAHFATFPSDLIETPIKAGCPPQGIILDPFMGSGTTALMARHLERNYLGIELSRDYIKLAEKRLAQETLF